MTAGKLVPEMKQLRQDGLSKRAMAKRLGVSRTSVIRLRRLNKRHAPSWPRGSFRRYCVVARNLTTSEFLEQRIDLIVQSH